MALLACGLGAVAAAARQDRALVPLRLQTALTSSVREVAALRAVTITSPLAANPALPAGCLVQGEVRADAAASHETGRSALRVTISGVVDGDGVTHPIDGRLRTLDNVRETVRADGVVVGLEPLRAVPSRLETLLLLVAHAHPFLLVTAEGVRLADREADRPGIHLTAGTEFTLAVSPNDDLARMRCGATAPPVQPPSADVTAALDGTPMRSTADDVTVAADWINLAIAGTEPAIRAAFDAAGWTTAERTSLRVDVRTLLALATHHGYQEGPVSGLRLAGARPAMVYQKQNNTFAKRHHIRLWPTARRLGGQPLWVAAATHDVGVEFSHAKKHFTHRIDGAIDDERTKVVGDLTFAGAVESVALVERGAVPRESRNAAGDAVTTDGRVAVVTFKTASRGR